MIPLRDQNRSTSAPVVTIALITANFVVLLLELATDDRGLRRMIYDNAVIPLLATRAWHTGGVALLEQGWRFLASMFMHDGWWHLLGNMWFLWIFGDNIEDRLGPLPFLIFYLVGGAFATATHIFMHGADRAPLIGASGAVATVLGAYAVCYPRARILTLVPVFLVWLVELPALVVLGMWFLLQFLYSSLEQTGIRGGGVAWWAHVGGFAFGAAAVYLLPKRKGFRKARNI